MIRAPGLRDGRLPLVAAPFLLVGLALWVTSGVGETGVPGEAADASPAAGATELAAEPKLEPSDRDGAPRAAAADDDRSESASVDPVAPAGDPLRIVIPAIAVDAPLVSVGLQSNRHMEVPPFGIAGWYDRGPKPGHRGPSVIAAHVDSRSGPDVFYRLGELTPGDQVTVVYDSGESVDFAVERDPVQLSKDELPGDDIWPRTDEHLLTLITCGGSFDRSTGHYQDNVIVFTSLTQHG